jgi:Zn-dependent protease
VSWILNNSSGDWRQSLLVLIFYVFAILSALILHEVAHGWVALKCGDPTPKFAGRLSLNPARHLDPVGALCFVLIGFGWAQPVPINPYNFRKYKLGCFLVSISGIVTNLIIGFTASFFFALLDNTGTIWAQLFAYIMVINIAFAVFNLLPVPPLDGFNMLASLTKPANRVVAWLRRNQMVMLIVLLLVIQFTGLFSIIHNFVVKLFLDFWGLIL